ncbi:unnamed protein product [Zymoseptoria tritici ST99CH_1A5]|nr:unnamed protein product [Zymoseptoria tritici ST99CH_3D7]SMR52498.1 unnamed protein product [Zymoseptoria tritici ST99CH_3D1]SMY24028.1 unnamed protein product [Zymoseptoria tritici ST99CH_1A5]
MAHDEASSKVTPDMESAKASAHLKSPETAIIISDSPPAADEAQQQQRPFRLLDLPDELWAKIGRMVIDDAPKITLRGKRVEFQSPWSIAWGRKTWDLEKCDLNPPGILQTCSALRRELRADYYRQKMVIYVAAYHARRENIEIIGRFLRAIGPDARKHIQGSYGEFLVRGVHEGPRQPRLNDLSHWKVEFMLTLEVPSSSTERIDWKIDFL